MECFTTLTSTLWPGCLLFRLLFNMRFRCYSFNAGDAVFQALPKQSSIKGTSHTFQSPSSAHLDKTETWKNQPIMERASVDELKTIFKSGFLKNFQEGVPSKYTA